MVKKITVLIIAFILFSLAAAKSNAAQQGELRPQAYLPLVIGPPEFVCATSSSNAYISGTVFQHDTDNPVRPAYNHADKNIELRGYVLNTDPNLKRELVNYNSHEPVMPPQFDTLFNPHQIPSFAEFFRVHQWSWDPSPDSGTRDLPITVPSTTAVSFILPPGKTLHAPVSGYDIGGSQEVIVLFADADTVTLHYTREDTAAVGYTLHIDHICTDPNLLSLYNALDAANGPRNQYPSPSYHLPTLPAGKVFGTTGSRDIVVAIADTGAFQDPRSCTDWWQAYQNYGKTCSPTNQLSFPEVSR